MHLFIFPPVPASAASRVTIDSLFVNQSITVKRNIIKVFPIKRVNIQNDFKVILDNLKACNTNVMYVLFIGSLVNSCMYLE